MCRNNSTLRKFYKRNRCCYEQFSGCMSTVMQPDATYAPKVQTLNKEPSCRDKSSGNPSGAVQGCEGVSRLLRARTRLTRPQAPVLSPHLGGLFPWAVSTTQAACLAALVLWGWARRKCPRAPFPLPCFWEGRRPASHPLHWFSWPLLSFHPWGVVVAECGWGRERTGREGTPKSSPMDHIRYQAPGMMSSVWPGWRRSSAHQMLTSNPQVCRGRNLPSVSMSALKMWKKSPPNLNPKERLSPRSAPCWWKGGKKEGKQPRCVWYGGLFLVGNTQPFFLFTLITPQHKTVVLKKCFMKSKVMFSGNLYLDYKWNSANRRESLQIQDRVWNIYDLCAA